MKKPFESARLTYRAVNSSDVELLEVLSADSTSFAYSNNTILRPVGVSWSENLLKYLDTCLLGVIISAKPLPPTTSGWSSHSPPIGMLLLTAPSSEELRHRHSDLSIDILASYQRKGYGSEAIKWALNWGFQTAGLHRVCVSCFGWNTGAARLYAHLGFVLEGEKREELWFDGKWWNLLIFGLLEDEWRAKGEVVELLEDN